MTNQHSSTPAARQTNNMRPVNEIMAELQRVSHEPGFIYTFCAMVSQALWMTSDEVAEIDWHQRPNHQELSLLLGLLVKSPIDLHEAPSIEAVADQVAKATELLDELHRSCAFLGANPAGQELGFPTASGPSLFESYEDWMSSGQGIVEPIFYGDPGAYIFQYLEMAEQRYALDQDWIENHVGVDLAQIIEIANALHRLTLERLQNIEPELSPDQKVVALLSAMSFHTDDLPGIGQHAVKRFFSIFSFIPGTVNQQFDAMGSYNIVHSHPAAALEDGRYCVPLLPNLAESVYASPFYWMLEDNQYKDTALKNRGDTTEIITRDLLIPVFGASRVHRGVKVKKGNADITDLDALAFSGNKALIVQCKSKKLTLTARAGDGTALRRDFVQAVQDAYEQGLKGREALLAGECRLEDEHGNSIELTRDVDEVYLLCVTGDHYPAVISQARIFLEKQEDDPHPVIMSIFDLDVVAHYLNDRFDLLYYLRQRTIHEAHFIADSEMNLLGFHLKHKLFPHEDMGGTLITADYTQLVDANFLVVRGGWPDTGSTQRLFHGWKNERFDELVRDIKIAARQQSSQDVAAEDLLFFLFDLAGQGADYLIDSVERCKRATLADGQRHDFRLPPQRDKKGVTFVSFPAPSHPIQAQVFKEDLTGIALAHKYRSRADEWMALASFAGSDVSFDIFGYIKGTWDYDPEIERAVETALRPGIAVGADGKKLGRNQPCPCGSGKKFKRCCLR